MHSDRNGEGGAGPVEQRLTWDDEDVATPERQGFFCLYKNQMLISLMPATNLPGVIFLAVLYATQVVAKAIAAYTNEYAWAHTEHNQEYAKNKVDGKTLTVEKYLDVLLSLSTWTWWRFPVLPTAGQPHVFLHMERRNCFRLHHQNLQPNDTNFLCID